MEQKLFVKPIAWHNGAIRLIDQTRLPAALKYEECRRVSDVWRAIKKLKVRGAPLIGIAGALGFFLGMRKAKAKDLFKEAKKLNRYLASSRPTAINLSWALNMMQAIVETHQGASKKNILGLLKTEVERLIYEDTQMCF